MKVKNDRHHDSPIIWRTNMSAVTLSQKYGETIIIIIIIIIIIRLYLEHHT